MQLQQPFAIGGAAGVSGFLYQSPISIVDNAYYSAISINAAQVPSTQTDFPVLVSVTDARFKTVGNGGHVQNANGYDIRPYTDSSLTTPITGYELERYNASTGEVIMWIKVSSLSSSTTPFVLRYGDASITTDGSSTTTWSNHFLAVYHLADGTTLSVNSATGTNNGTNHSATATTGQIDGAAAFVSASSQYIDLGSMSLGTAVQITISAWVNATSFPNAYNCVLLRNNANTDYAGILVKSNGKLAGLLGTSGTDKSYDGTGSHTLSASTWYYLTLTYENSLGLVGYVNAASDQTHAGGANLNSAGIQTDISRDNVNAGRFFNGAIDEARVADQARSQDWITTEYNNQSAPGTFMTLGSEVSRGVPSTQTDFPVLVSVTDNRFKTVGNGGHVQNSSGFDIRPYSDSGISTAITGYELERYNASTGEVIMWVKVGSLTSSSTPIYLAYGNSGISTDGSSTSAWDSNFKGVWHLKDGTTLSGAESTSSAATLSFVNTPTATSGKIDGAANFASASTQSTSGPLDCSAFTAITFSVWVNATSLPNAENAIGFENVAGTRYIIVMVRSDGKLTVFMANPARSYDGTGSHTLSTGTWYLIHFTYDSTQGMIVYVNAASDGTGSAGGNLSISSLNSEPTLATDPVNAGRNWNGKLDEARISNVARSANWITTEYNNQSAPGTFETLGTEVPL